MKYDKKTEQLLAVPNSAWKISDVTYMAQMIKANPADDNLKNRFLNLDPRLGDSCNKVLYSMLTDIYSWLLKNNNVIYTLDEYTEAIIMYVFNRSFVDWRPGDSLQKYFKTASYPHAPVGRDISRMYYYEDALSLEEPSANNPDYTIGELIIADVPDVSAELELNELIEEVTKIVRLSDIEVHLLTTILPNQRLTPEHTANLNSVFGTNYTVKELSALRKNAIHRVNYKQKELQEFKKKYL